MTLKKDAFCYYSAEESGWKLEPGQFRILVGSSSRDIRLEGHVNI